MQSNINYRSFNEYWHKLDWLNITGMQETLAIVSEDYKWFSCGAWCIDDYTAMIRHHLSKRKITLTIE